jgi:2-hydroxychromene-2-carboxylate isomerase
VLTPNPSPGRRGGAYYFDVVSPFAYLLNATFDRSPVPIELDRKPVLLAGMLQAFGQKGPAEIAAKRTFTYEYCIWLAQQHGIPFLMPAAHPFNPIRYLRLILALKCDPVVISAVFHTIFATGQDPGDPGAWNSLTDQLGVADADSLIEAPAVKQLLRANTDEAVARGVFGVPTIAVDAKLFFGFDSLPMLAAYLAGDRFFMSDAMQSVAKIKVGATRTV